MAIQITALLKISILCETPSKYYLCFEFLLRVIIIVDIFLKI